MVRDNRIKYYTFDSVDLTGDATTGLIDTYTDNPLNGRIQSIYFEAGNWDATGSIMISVSGVGTEGTILNQVSGTATERQLDADWVVFPRVATIDTTGVTISGADGYDEFAEIPIWSNIRVQTGVVGTGSTASGLTIVYI